MSLFMRPKVCTCWSRTAQVFLTSVLRCWRLNCKLMKPNWMLRTSWWRRTEPNTRWTRATRSCGASSDGSETSSRVCHISLRTVWVVSGLAPWLGGIQMQIFKAVLDSWGANKHVQILLFVIQLCCLSFWWFRGFCRPWEHWTCSQRSSGHADAHHTSSAAEPDRRDPAEGWWTGTRGEHPAAERRQHPKSWEATGPSPPSPVSSVSLTKI